MIVLYVSIYSNTDANSFIKDVKYYSEVTMFDDIVQ